MKPSADQEAVPGDAAVPTLASSVYERLRDDILRGQLAPGGKLRIEFVSERYDAGNSPVREALNRLSSDGLVDRRDQRGFYVAAASVADLLELTRTRCWLEEIGLRESIRAFTPGWEEGMVLALHRLGRVPRSISPDTYQENPEWERLHRAFHRSLIAGCGSRWLMGFCEQLADQAYRYRQLSARQVFPKRKEKNEHQAIVDAALRRDVELAVALLCEHYHKTAEIIVALGKVAPAAKPAKPLRAASKVSRQARRR